MKVLFGTALRQVTWFVESLLRFVGLDWDMLDFSTRRQKTLAVNIPHRGAQGALPLLIDEETHEVRAVEVTSSDIGDAPMLPDLLAHITAVQGIASVTAPSHGLRANRCRATDGANDTRKCHEAIADRGAVATIPPRKHAKPWQGGTAEGAGLNLFVDLRSQRRGCLVSVKRSGVLDSLSTDADSDFSFKGRLAVIQFAFFDVCDV